ncbi:hypothetical protein Scep_019561 [Stephania cephalantha]|uniref:Uncharacterized protein n=1 Tax=Stephania cephalantha TaxID=152367 RepID=A0AAP0NLH2_9MAGN
MFPSQKASDPPSSSSSSSRLHFVVVVLALLPASTSSSLSRSIVVLFPWSSSSHLLPGRPASRRRLTSRLALRSPHPRRSPYVLSPTHLRALPGRPLGDAHLALAPGRRAPSVVLSPTLTLAPLAPRVGASLPGRWSVPRSPVAGRVPLAPWSSVPLAPGRRLAPWSASSPVVLSPTPHPRARSPIVLYSLCPDRCSSIVFAFIRREDLRWLIWFWSDLGFGFVVLCDGKCIVALAELRLFRVAVSVNFVRFVVSSLGSLSIYAIVVVLALLILIRVEAADAKSKEVHSHLRSLDVEHEQERQQTRFGRALAVELLKETAVEWIFACGQDGGVRLPREYVEVMRDLVLLVTTRPTTGNTLAWAVARERDQWGHAIAGHVNVAPRHLILEAHTLLSPTLIHEVMHVLGFDPHAFAHFRDERKKGVIVYLVDAQLDETSKGKDDELEESFT